MKIRRSDIPSFHDYFARWEKDSKDFKERMDANDKKWQEMLIKQERDRLAMEESIKADRKEAAERLEAMHRKTEERLAADRKEAAERLEAMHRNTEERLQADRKEAEEKSNAERKWLVSGFFTLLGSIGVLFVTMLIMNG